ncbi:MAG TPA: hypothetical protein VMR21_08170, partial [Vicinamibacteria bacterium]|nr:hypothetical protein [Vicinamibacteria bacterium]
YTLLGVTLFVPMIAGLYVRRVRTPEVLASMAAGIGATLAVQLLGGPGGFGVVSPALAGLAASAAACLLVLALRRRRPEL